MFSILLQDSSPPISFSLACEVGSRNSTPGWKSPRIPRSRPSRRYSTPRASQPITNLAMSTCAVPDFVYVEKYPTITFESTKVTPVDDNWRVTGDLTIRGRTNPVDLDVRFLGMAVDWGNVKSLFSARTTIDRFKWDMTWNRAIEWGGVAVGQEAVLEIYAQMKLITDDSEAGPQNGGTPQH